MIKHFAFYKFKKTIFSFFKILTLSSFLLSQLFIAEILLYKNDNTLYDHTINTAYADTTDPWYDTSWLYRKEISITGSDSDLTDYQIKLTISYETGKMNSDFSDLRFVGSDGATLYDYYIESYTDSTSADIWIEIDSIPSTGTYIFMYYGNSVAASSSDKDNTLSKWTQTSDEDFNGGTLDVTITSGDTLSIRQIYENISWSEETDWGIPGFSRASPSFADLDNDGDYDLMMGAMDGITYAYKNTGTASAPIWTAETDWNAPDVGSYACPYLTDLDNDGDYDLLIGEMYGITFAYKNTGTASAPIWTAETDWNAPDVGYNASPALADLDNDGDYDLLVGESTGLTYAYENTGNSSSPAWTANPSWDIEDIGESASPAFADLDNDGDYDLLVGEDSGIAYGYQNTGDSSAPVWTAESSWDTEDIGSYAFPFLCDLDNDGDYDLMIGEFAGTVYAYKNTGDSSAPVWTAESGWDTDDIGQYIITSLVDLDNDGDYDLMIGEYTGITFAYKNTGTTSAPIWTAESGWNAPDIGLNAAPAFADLDNDGDYDAMIGERYGIIRAYKNVGTDSSPSWTAETDWNIPDIGSYPRPSFADLDNDGDYDLMIGESSGVAYAFKNTGTASAPVWTAEPSWDTEDIGDRSCPSLSDIDDDGDYDLMIGGLDGITYAYKNTGTVLSPVWTAEPSWNVADIGLNSSPTFADLDNDGDLDFMAGDSIARVYSYKNLATLAYSSSGSFISSSFDSTSLIKPQSISFGSTVPADTTLKFQLATNDDDTTWNFIGPDGTDTTYYDEDEELTSEDLDDKRYVSYKVFMETSDTSVTPNLSDMTIYYAKSASIEPAVTMNGEEALSSSTAGGVFTPPSKPDIQDITIDNSEGYINLSNLPSSITHIAISQNPDFTDSSWEDISDKDNILSQYQGTIYIKLRTNQGASSDIITYDTNSNEIISDNQYITLDEGDIVKTQSSFDVYIIKYNNQKRYKRLILSPTVFNSYQHLKWENIKTILEEQLNLYTTSNLVNVKGDNNIYYLTPDGDTGTKEIVATYDNGILRLTQDDNAGDDKDIDVDSIYEINEVDRESYGGGGE